MLAHASVHCQGRSLFRPLGSPGGTGGPASNFEGNNFIYQSDIVSQQRLGPSPAASAVRCRGWLGASATPSELWTPKPLLQNDIVMQVHLMLHFAPVLFGTCREV